MAQDRSDPTILLVDDRILIRRLIERSDLIDDSMKERFIDLIDLITSESWEFDERDGSDPMIRLPFEDWSG